MTTARLQLFGYVAGDDTETPSALEEVTFASEPRELRRIAAFLEHVAKKMDEYGEKFGHEHLGDFAPEFGGSPSVVVTAYRDDMS